MGPSLELFKEIEPARSPNPSADRPWNTKSTFYEQDPFVKIQTILLEHSFHPFTKEAHCET